MDREAVAQAIAATLRVSEADLAIARGGSGGNSRIYVVTLDGRKLIAKQYFRHPADPRDRLQAEWDFLQYAQRAGIGCVPQPIAHDTKQGIGIYEHIAGS